jgi:hypothetical protein
MSALINHYTPCQIKFAFDVDTKSPLAWCEYFGFEDTFDMLKAFCKQHLVSKTLCFQGTDGSGAKSVVIFETTCDPSDFNTDYALACSILNKISENPIYNDDVSLYNHMIETLDESGVEVCESEPESRVFDEYNFITHGHKNHTLAVQSIAKRKAEEKAEKSTAKVA